MVIADPTEQPLSLLTRSGFLERVGRHNVEATLPLAAGRAREVAAADERGARLIRGPGGADLPRLRC